MLMGGGAFATPRHVFWNFVSSSRDRINQAKEDWKARRFPLIPGDDEEFIPLPAVPDDGQLSVTEASVRRRSPLADRRHAQRRAGRRRPTRRRSSCSTAFPNRTAPGAAIAPLLRGPLPAGHARPARLCRLGPAAGRRGLSHRHASSTTCSRWPTRWASIASPWSATIGAARSPGRRRCAAIRASSGWRSSTRRTR